MSNKMITLGIVVLMAISQSASAQEFTGGSFSGISGPTSSEQLYPYDSQEPWMHGYFQRMPFHGGFRTFRPYNYRHVFAQSQTAAGWGMSPTMPYSQQFWHQFEAQANKVPYQSVNAPTLQSQNYGQPLHSQPKHHQPINGGYPVPVIPSETVPQAPINGGYNNGGSYPAIPPQPAYPVR